MSREERIKYALDIASASQLVERSKLGPFSFLDQRGIDCLTRGSMNLMSRKKEWGHESDRLYESFLKITNFEELVQLASNGLNVYHSVTLLPAKSFKRHPSWQLSLPLLILLLRIKRCGTNLLTTLEKRVFTLWRLQSGMC